MSKSKGWFEVDKEGLAKLLERRGKEYILFELIQNAWDTGAKKVEVTLKSVPETRSYASLQVTDDDPDGFKDLTHAFTLFAESEKKANPEKRGRFNLGEKLVLALCAEGRIQSTKGTVVFGKNGREMKLNQKRAAGTVFSAIVKMTKDEVEQVLAAVHKLLPPADVETVVNGTPIQFRSPLATFSAQLPTEIADGEGVLRRSARNTEVEVLDLLPGEQAFVYELGIPVVETGDRWHYNVMQKVPLNVDRDNVTPAYLRQIRTEVLNCMHAALEPNDACEGWVRDAAGDDKADADAVTRVMDLRFGEKRVIHDPSDIEGTKLAVSKGYTVIPPRSLSKDEWTQVKLHGAALPAGQVTPSPKTYGDGPLIQELPASEWTPAMREVAVYAQMLAEKLMGIQITIRMEREIKQPYIANYGSHRLTFNLGRLGHKWFNDGIRPKVDELLIHEFGHEFSSDHLSSEYHHALCKLGARLAALALEEPEVFAKFGRKAVGV